MKFNLSIDNIKYVKLLMANSEGNPISVKAAIKKMDEKEIVTCFKIENDFNIKNPQQITLSIICEEGLYRTQTQLKSCSCEAPYIFISLETPSSLEYQQNREYFRIPALYNCVYYVNNNGQPASFNATTADISANGVSIILPVHVFSEEDAEIEMMVKEKLITAKIRYVRSEKIPDGYKLSFTYSDISNRDRDYISQICIQKQLEDKRNKPSN
jgi:c-di-GMP-binding flagellar brake protein YcgR